MRMYDLIMKKRNQGSLTGEEIRFLVEGYTQGRIPDYQMSAMMMAIYFNGMDEEETLHLTMAMAHSGDMLDLSGIAGRKADKHSTGGVGDKTSLVLIPLMASLGVPMAKMSGRGLGHTGGTIDKLESIPGFRTNLSMEEFIRNVDQIKMAITGQTGNLAPADKKLYALRDVTATVDSIHLIASSIMSKKLAAGADVIVLDVKSGSGAFMKNEEEARKLAETMVKIGQGAGRETVAVISDMDQPLGRAVGNALELQEAIETLQGRGPADLEELVVTLGAHILMCLKQAESFSDAEKTLREALCGGKAIGKFREFVEAQGGDSSCISDPGLLPTASIIEEIPAPQAGYVKQMMTEEMGRAVLLLGGGREVKDGDIDLSVGLVLHKKTGDQVGEGESLATIHANDRKKLEAAREMILGAYQFSGEAVPKPRLIKFVCDYTQRR